MSFSRTLSARSLSNKAREECMRAYAEVSLQPAPIDEERSFPTRSTQ